MDDGTTACLSDNHYLMTTTTAAAGQVMKHLELVSQCYCPDWDVQMISVTEQWAQFAIAGPRARDVLATVLAEDEIASELPFMGCAEVNVMGTKGRLFRISFSGEIGFELAVPARFGDSLFRLLVTHAEALGGGPYGMEALNVLRIEKGFITHAEIHGRVTASDIGMGRMVSQKKDCIGKFMAARPGLTEPGREQLIGLQPVGSVKQLTAGAHLFDPGMDAVSENDQGYITSVAFSPTLERMLGMAFLKDGHSRMGQHVRMVDHLRGIEALCEVTDLVAFDKEGERLRG
jgi:sarcosine oxidase subunit alpha